MQASGKGLLAPGSTLRLSIIHCQEIEHLLNAGLWSALARWFSPAMLKIPHKRFDLIAGECLPKGGHRSPAVQNLLAQLGFILSAPDSAEIRSLVTTDPVDQMALGAPLLMKLCRSALLSRFSGTGPRKRQSENQK